MFSFLLNQLLHFMATPPLPLHASHFLCPIRVFNLHNGKHWDSHPNLLQPPQAISLGQRIGIHAPSLSLPAITFCVKFTASYCPSFSLFLSFSSISISSSSFGRCFSRFTHFYDSHSASPSEMGGFQL